MSHLAVFFGARRGGVEGTQLGLAAALAPDLDRVTLVMPRLSATGLESPAGQIERVELGTDSYRATLLALARFFRRHEPDRVLASQHHFNCLAACALRLAGHRSARLVAVFHNHVGELVRRQPWGLALRLALPATLGRAQVLVGVSHGVVRDLEQRLPALAPRLRTIHNGVCRKTLEERAREGSVPALGLQGDEGPPLLVAVGRLVAQKAHEVLVQAMARVRQPCRLAVLGAGELGPSLRALARDLGLENRVRFLGHVDNPYPWIQAARALISTSRWEGFGLVLIEALALGVPVIATDCPSGPAEVLGHGRWGSLVPVGDPHALAGAIDRLLLEGPRVSAAEARARADELSLERMVAGYRSALELG